MATSVGRLCDLIEIYARNVDPKLSGNKELIRKIINMKLKEFSNRTGLLSSSATRLSIADQTEYELPEDCLHVTDVIFDDYRAYKIHFEDVKNMQDQA